LFGNVYAKDMIGTWYSIASLKREGTWKPHKGKFIERRMANGKHFSNSALTCACRIYNLGDVLLITNRANGKKVRVVVTDRIGKRFATTRIDLSKGAFEKISDLQKGVILITVERIG
jgi:rare lipoprotein A